MKKTLLATMFLAILIAIFPLISNAASSNLFLNSLNIEAQILENGDMRVCEYWDIDIEETNTLYKSFNIDSSKYSGIADVQISMIESGTEIPLSKADKWAYHLKNNSFIGAMNPDNQFEICWGVGLDNSSDTRHYKIEYTVKDAISKYNDCAELYWQFVGSDFEVNIGKITGTILLPSSADSLDQIRVWGHTKGLNGTIHATDLNKAEFEVDGLNSGNFMEVRVAFPPSMVQSSPGKIHAEEQLAKIISEETNWANKANAQRNQRILFFTGLIGIFFVIVFFQIKKSMQKLSELKENFIPEPEAPKYFRDIPDESASPAEALKLKERLTGVFRPEDFGSIFSATLLALYLKGFIDLEIVSKKESLLKLNLEKDIETNPNSTEREIYKFIKTAFKDDTQLNMKNLQKYIQRHSDKTLKLKEKIDKLTEQTLVEKEMFDTKCKKEYNNYSAFSLLNIFEIMGIAGFAIFLLGENMPKFVFSLIIILFIAAIVNLVYILRIKKKIAVFTAKGKERSNQWKGLKNFMDDFSMLDKREVPEIVLWEKYLVFATVFKISKKVIKQLKIVYPELQNDDVMMNYAYLSVITNPNFSSFSDGLSHSISTAFSAESSSGSGFGGGFSGGGGFGGGRWRRRRKVNIVYKQLNVIFKAYKKNILHESVKCSFLIPHNVLSYHAH